MYKRQADAPSNVQSISTCSVSSGGSKSSSSSSSSEGSFSRAEISQLQGRGEILIDDYGVPLDESSSSSEIMARIPPLVFSARKQRWMHVMAEYNIPASKAESWARDYDDVHALIATVEGGTLSGSILEARLHECDSGVLHVLAQNLYGDFIRVDRWKSLDLVSSYIEVDERRVQLPSEFSLLIMHFAF